MSPSPTPQQVGGQKPQEVKRADCPWCDVEDEIMGKMDKQFHIIALYDEKKNMVHVHGPGDKDSLLMFVKGILDSAKYLGVEIKEFNWKA